MDCGHSPKLLHYLTISFILLLITFTTHFSSSAKGRMLVKPATNSQVDVEKTFLREQIGSRPPRCERRCGSCGHCEAIQGPTTPQIKAAKSGVNDPTVGATNAYRGDYSSNYKPMSWKCKCGSLIFDP